MNIMLDTNIILDFIAVQHPWYQDAASIWKRIRADDDRGYVSASALTDIYYITKRKLDQTLAFKAIQLCHTALAICTVDRAIITRALTLQGKDFEDNVVIACAERENLDAIITRNRQDFQHASMLVYTPAEWLASVS